MCEMCERPELLPDEVRLAMQEEIDRDRFLMVHIQASTTMSEFGYTAGLTEQGLPELIVTAVPSQSAFRLLGLWSEYLLDTSTVLPGETLGSGPWLLEAVAVDRPQERLHVAHRLYGDRVRALQLVWADRSGRLPWDHGHRARQPVLGPRAPRYCAEHDPNRLDVPPHL